MSPEQAPEPMAQLVPEMYDRLRGIAAAIMSRNAPGVTLEPTAIVHEAWLRARRSGIVAAGSRVQAVACLAGMMEQALIDAARARRAKKRGGGWDRVFLSEVGRADEVRPEVDALALSEALVGLRSRNERQADVIRLRYFGGLTNAEVARHLEVSTRQVERDWEIARTWLSRELKRDPDP